MKSEIYSSIKISIKCESTDSLFQVEEVRVHLKKCKYAIYYERNKWIRAIEVFFFLR